MSSGDEVAPPSAWGSENLRASTLTLEPGTSFDDWSALGRWLSTAAVRSTWLLGDWLNFGERNFPSRYREAADRTSLGYQTLRNYAWIARKFSPAERREDLSFQHHAEVAALATFDRARWLDRAARFGWSRNTLRQYLRTSRRTTSPALANAAPLAKLELTVDALRRSRWEHTASLAGSALEDWIVEVLDRTSLSLPQVDGASRPGTIGAP